MDKRKIVKIVIDIANYLDFKEAFEERIKELEYSLQDKSISINKQKELIKLLILNKEYYQLLIGGMKDGMV